MQHQRRENSYSCQILIFRKRKAFSNMASNTRETNYLSDKSKIQTMRLLRDRRRIMEHEIELQNHNTTLRL